MNSITSPSFNSRTLLIDGVWGCGKSLLSSLLHAFPSINPFKIDSIFDNIPILNSLGLIDASTATTLLSMRAHELNHYNSVGREINLRISDDSSYFKSPWIMSHIYKMLSPQPSSIVLDERINNTCLSLMTHMSSFNNNIISTALGESLFILHPIRDPLSLYPFWIKYLPRLSDNNDFRELTVKCTLGTSYSSQIVPWFLLESNEDISDLSIPELAILSIFELYSMLQKSLQIYPGGRYIISFDNAIKHPDRFYEFIERLTDFKSVSLFKYLRKKSARVPRQIPTYSPDLFCQFPPMCRTPSEIDVIMEHPFFLTSSIRSRYRDYVALTYEIYFDLIKQSSI